MRIRVVATREGEKGDGVSLQYAAGQTQLTGQEKCCYMVHAIFIFFYFYIIRNMKPVLPEA